MKTLLTIGACALVTASAFAQENTGYIRLGYNSVARNSAGGTGGTGNTGNTGGEQLLGNNTSFLTGPGGSTGTGFLIGYGMPLSMSGASANTMAGWEVDWFRNGSSNRFDTYMATFRYGWLSDGFYFGAGAGIAYHDINTATVDVNGTRAVFNGFVGYQFEQFSMEWGYYWSGKMSGQNLDRWALSVGFKF